MRGDIFGATRVVSVVAWTLSLLALLKIFMWLAPASQVFQDHFPVAALGLPASPLGGTVVHARETQAPS